MSHDVVRTQFAGDERRIIRAPVVDDELFHGGEARDRARQVGERGGQRSCFIITGYLNNQFHDAVIVQIRLRYRRCRVIQHARPEVSRLVVSG